MLGELLVSDGGEEVALDGEPGVTTGAGRLATATK